MATTTPNFGWSVPTSTDYVKDGAVAIETLGDSIDASLVDLKGGTTGQVLSKNTNTDMDFVWVTPNDADAIQNTIVDAKGDLITATTADTPARLAVGANGTYLKANSSTATGLEWGTVSAGWTLIATATPSGATTVSFTSIPTTYTQLRVVWDSVTQSSADNFYVRLNNDSGNNYGWHAIGGQTPALASNFAQPQFGSNTNNAVIGNTTNTTENAKGTGWFQVERANVAADHVASWSQMSNHATTGSVGCYIATGCYTGTAAAVTQIDFVRSASQTITGNFYLYGI